jgi:glucosylceramidase
MKTNVCSALVLAAVVGLGATPVLAAGPVAVYQTVKGRPAGLKKTGDLNWEAMPQPREDQPAVFIDAAHQFQAVVGIGGAFTDAAAETFYKLPPDRRRDLIRAYFDPVQGIGYSLGRTTIHSSDFSSESYTYVKEGDAALASFSVAHDLKYRIPFIKEALAVAGKEFSLFVSPWSPPAWMKDNQEMLHGGKLKPEFYDAWASYFVKFIQAYQAQGIPIWGLTVQNEPMAVQTWESCIYTAQEERDFVKGHLGPALTKAGLSDKKLMIWDHNRGLIFQRARELLDDPETARYVWGIAYHWYVGDHFDNVSRVHEAFPQAHLLFSEGCHGPFDAAKLEDWNWGELYATSMIHDFNNGVEGWTDWNVLLDENGGPNHVGNFCFAPVHGDTRTGALRFMNSYYYIGHFSKFVRPGARRISCSTTEDDLLATAFLNPNGTAATVVMNATDKDKAFYLWSTGRAARCESPAHSISTLVAELK